MGVLLYHVELIARKTIYFVKMENKVLKLNALWYLDVSFIST
jgi:hypothetical protein